MEKVFRILVIDDDELMSFVLKNVLTKNGYDVFVHNTAVNIFATVDRFKPNIIIMDHNMPLVSGIEATRLLKGNDITATIPIIYFTSALNIKELAEEAGSDGFLSKSSNTKYILQTIKKFLSNT